MRIARRITRAEDLRDDLNFTDCPFRIAIIMEELDALEHRKSIAYLRTNIKIR